MDAQVQSTQLLSAGAYPTWDFAYVNGKVPILSGNLEASQQAAVGAFTQLGLVPQLTSVGQDWIGLATGNVTLSQIDISINDTLTTNGKAAFAPSYSLKNDSISVSIKKPVVPVGIN